MFVNFSNHPSQYWDNSQREASLDYGELIDIPFPQISPNANDGELEKLAQDGNTRDFRDLARLHVIAARGDEMSARDVEKYLSDVVTKSSPFYYTAILTIAQKYLSQGERDAANKWLDKLLNDPDCPAEISGTVQTLR